MTSADGPSQIQTGNETVLLVEDEDAVRRLVRLLLEVAGYVVLEAASGADALAICEQHDGPIHLLVTDIGMPSMSGVQLAERVELLRANIKVLYLSGYTGEAIVSQGAMPFGSSFLNKPFSTADLTRKVREMLDAGVDPSQTSEVDRS